MNTLQGKAQQGQMEARAVPAGPKAEGGLIRGANAEHGLIRSVDRENGLIRKVGAE